MPLGMEDRRILPGHLRASSSYNYNHGPDRARLNMINAHSRTGGWMAKYRNQKQWLQIDCRQMSIIKGIATQGRRAAQYWVSSYDLSYGVDGRRFKAYSVGGRIKVRYMTPLFYILSHWHTKLFPEGVLHKYWRQKFKEIVKLNYFPNIKRFWSDNRRNISHRKRTNYRVAKKH